MQTAASLTTKSLNKALQQEILYYTFILRHINERLSDLQPGINTNANNYSDLLSKRDFLTSRIIDVILYSRGSTFDEIEEPIYLYPSLAIPISMAVYSGHKRSA